MSQKEVIWQKGIERIRTGYILGQNYIKSNVQNRLYKYSQEVYITVEIDKLLLSVLSEW